MGSGHKDKPKLLIEFDAIVDFKLGYWYLMKETNSEIINPDIINCDLNRLRELRRKEDFFNYFFKDQGKFSHIHKEAYSDIFKEENHNFYGSKTTIYENSPLNPAIEKLIVILNSNMAKSAGAGDLCHLLAWNPEQFAILKSRFPNCMIIDTSGKEKFECNEYARIIISEASHVNRFKTTFTKMAVLAYPENLEVIDGKKAIADRQAMADIHFTNVFEFIDPI